MKDERLFEPRYGISAAAHHLRMPRSTIVSWTHGTESFKHVLCLPKPGYLSFINLTEAFVLYAMRRHYRIPMPHIREAIAYVEAEMGVTHPLAFQQFATDGADLFVKTALGAVNASRRGQQLLHDLTISLERIEWRSERPIALFPIVPHSGAAESRPIRISPLVAFGRPVIAGTGIPTQAVADRFYGGESTSELAEDYGVSAAMIEEAVRAEREPVAA